MEKEIKATILLKRLRTLLVGVRKKVGINCLEGNQSVGQCRNSSKRRETLPENAGEKRKRGRPKKIMLGLILNQDWEEFET